MKFAHFSDCHVGGWREDVLKLLSIYAFSRAMDICIERQMDFILIAGDLFNNAVPTIDAIKDVTQALKKVKDHSIAVYLVPGSHDYSPSGKTMLDVLERAGLCVNLYRYDGDLLTIVQDPKTGVKLAGMCGLRGGLEKLKYQTLAKEHLERAEGFKIFVFHTLLNELKTPAFDLVPGEPLAALPKGFTYYAGGHPHFVRHEQREGYGIIAYPGPLFPNNFKELEELKHGGFWIVDDKLQMEHVAVPLKKVVSFHVRYDQKTPAFITADLKQKFLAQDLTDTIVTLRIEGIIDQGKLSDIPFHDLFASVPAYCILKNTAKLTTKELQDIPVEEGPVDDVERTLITEACKTSSFVPPDHAQQLILQVMQSCMKEKDEGERNVDFEQRVVKDLLHTLALQEHWTDAA